MKRDQSTVSQHHRRTAKTMQAGLGLDNGANYGEEHSRRLRQDTAIASMWKTRSLRQVTRDRRTRFLDMLAMTAKCGSKGQHKPSQAQAPTNVAHARTEGMDKKRGYDATGSA
jgi:hypothetical protein